MADRYQNRAFPTGNDDDRDWGFRQSAESDPLAELARLIGQTDPFGTRPMSRANLPVQQQPARPADPEPSYDSYVGEDEPEDVPPPAPPAWMQRAARQEAPPPPPPPPPEDDYPASVHPLHRYAASHPPAEPEYESEQLFADSAHDHEPDLSRYDDALYGGFDSGAQTAQHDQNYASDGYAYDEDQHFDEQPQSRRRGGMITVAAVLALAVFGVGGALAYRSYTGGTRGGEPPIIRADVGPTKIIPAPADVAAKVPDRMSAGDGTEKIVSREETPVDPNARTGPRVVFPPLTPNGSAALPSTLVPGAAPPAAANNVNGTFANNEPHRVRTTPVRGDQADAGVPANAPPPPAAAKSAARTPAAAARPTNPNAANANAPLSLAPQADNAPPPELQRVANNAPQAAPSAPATPSAAAASGGYLVQISSQRSEADAQASFKALQGKFPSVLGSRAAVIKRADLGDKGTYYRAMVGPFGSSEEASQFCGSLKSAGGQCVIQRN